MPTRRRTKTLIPPRRKQSEFLEGGEDGDGGGLEAVGKLTFWVVARRAWLFKAVTT